MHAETRAEDAVERGRCAAALQDGRARRCAFPCQCARRLRARRLPDAAEPVFAAVRFCCISSWPSFGRAPSATTINVLRHPSASRCAHGCGDFFVIERNLRQQDNVAAAGETAVECDPSGVTSHHFDDHRALWLLAVVCSRSSASATHATAQSKPKVIAVASRSLSIVFGTPTDRDAGFGELQRRRQRTIAADDDERPRRASRSKLFARLLDDLGWQ